jgi:cyclic pyranopterin phosphate synthase
MSEQSLSHVDADGKLRMVDVSAKSLTRRTARASCVVVTSIDLTHLGATALGLDVIQSARLKGIQAAKITANLIPLCHPLGLDDIHLDVLPHARGVEVRSTVSTVARTGVEMEALVACTYCALSLLDSLLSHDSTSRCIDLAILTKTGGKSDWGRETESPSPSE